MKIISFSFFENSKKFLKGFTPTPTFTKSCSEFIVHIFGGKIQSVCFCNRKLVRGFTLIELMVSIGVMSILTTILFSNYPDSMVRIGLANTTHKISLLIREAQVRGSAIDSRSSLNIVSGYGVYVSNSDIYNLTLFSDFASGGTVVNGISLGDGLYNKTPTDEMISSLKLLQKFYISNLCVKTGGVQSCFLNPTDNLIISFTRPNPRPNIYINNNISTDYDEACIEIKSPKAPLAGHIRSIKIYNTGFITTLINPCT